MSTEKNNIRQTCNERIDYSEVIGEKIIPFVIELNLETSILYPEEGQNQRFCYDITGVGQDKPEFANLSHIVFGICNKITEDEIVNISVIVDGEAKEVIFGEGGNVELKTPLKPDPPTGCPGLKFNFPLDKVSGIMNVCFELTTPYPVGGNGVCLFGGNTTAKGLSICGPSCGEIGETCPATGYQFATVCVPVTVTPFANPGTTTTHCCGDPVIVPDELECVGTNTTCTFTISQTICVEVPVEFGATATVGTAVVECGDVDIKDICSDCNGADEDISSEKSSSSMSTIKKTLKDFFCK